MQVKDLIVQFVLDNLKRPDGLKEIPASILLEDVKGKLENWKIGKNRCRHHPSQNSMALGILSMSHQTSQ
jgi:hypothetical protein